MYRSVRLQRPKDTFPRQAQSVYSGVLELASGSDFAAIFPMQNQLLGKSGPDYSNTKVIYERYQTNRQSS